MLPKETAEAVSAALSLGISLDPDTRGLLKEVSRHIKAGTPVPPDLYGYFDGAIQQTDLNKGFGLKEDKRHKAFKRLCQDTACYCAVMGSTLPISPVGTPGGVYEAVSMEQGVLESAVKTGYEKIKKMHPDGHPYVKNRRQKET